MVFADTWIGCHEVHGCWGDTTGVWSVEIPCYFEGGHCHCRGFGDEGVLGCAGGVVMIC